MGRRGRRSLPRLLYTHIILALVGERLGAPVASKPSPVGEGVSRRLTDEESWAQSNIRVENREEQAPPLPRENVMNCRGRRPRRPTWAQSNIYARTDMSTTFAKRTWQVCQRQTLDACPYGYMMFLYRRAVACCRRKKRGVEDYGEGILLPDK